MTSKRKTNVLYVYMNTLLVGHLERQPTGALQFSYDADWIRSDKGRPVSLSMPLRDQLYVGDIVTNFFDNLLPDNENIRIRIQRRFQTPTNQCFDLLSQIGADCVGALQLLTEPLTKTDTPIIATPIDDKAIAQLLRNYQTAPLGMDPDTDFRISIAGAQEKTALLWYDNQWQLPIGTTPTSHIIKLPIGYIQHAGIDLSESVENEWLCLQILAAFGLKTNQSTIVEFDGVRTLVVERFDRHWSNDQQRLLRIPQEDFCQALGVSSGLKYESDGGPSIAELMRILTGAFDSIHDRYHFMKSLFLFWVLGAIDGHAKNFSLLLETGGRYRLTPLYDVMSAYPLAAKRQLEWQNLKMAMALTGKNKHYRWHNMQLRHWFGTAERCQFDLSAMQNIIDEVFDTMDTVINQVSASLPSTVPIEMAEAIFTGMRKIKNRCTSTTMS